MLEIKNLCNDIQSANLTKSQVEILSNLVSIYSDKNNDSWLDEYIKANVPDGDLKSYKDVCQALCSKLLNALHFNEQVKIAMEELGIDLDAILEEYFEEE